MEAMHLHSVGFYQRNGMKGKRRSAMAKEELKKEMGEDLLEEVWDDRSSWNEEDIGSTLPELEQWDDMVRDLLPGRNSGPKEEPVQGEPVAELKAVQTKTQPPVAPVRSPETERGPAASFSDKQLLVLIHKHKEAVKICQLTRMTLQELQQRVARISYRIKRYIDVEGLYRDTGPVKMTQDGIHIPKGHLVDTAFSVGDLFKVGFKDDLIILARQGK
jgi:hypothetical protein